MPEMVSPLCSESARTSRTSPPAPWKEKKPSVARPISIPLQPAPAAAPNRSGSDMLLGKQPFMIAFCIVSLLTSRDVRGRSW
jgi:hypothetical protein